MLILGMKASQQQVYVCKFLTVGVLRHDCCRADSISAGTQWSQVQRCSQEVALGMEIGVETAVGMVIGVLYSQKEEAGLGKAVETYKAQTEERLGLGWAVGVEQGLGVACVEDDSGLFQSVLKQPQGLGHQPWRSLLGMSNCPVRSEGLLGRGVVPRSAGKWTQVSADLVSGFGARNAKLIRAGKQCQGSLQSLACLAWPRSPEASQRQMQTLHSLCLA